MFRVPDVAHAIVSWKEFLRGRAGGEGLGSDSRGKAWGIFVKIQALQKVIISKENCFHFDRFLGLPRVGVDRRPLF